MELAPSLLKEFAAITNDSNQKEKRETTYGTAVVKDGKTYVKMDGSDILTPVSTLMSVQDGDRVVVTVKDHTATVTGNATMPGKTREDVRSETIFYGKSETNDIDPSIIEWSETIPECPDGWYLWTKRVISYTDSSKPDTIDYQYVRQGTVGEPGNTIRTLTNIPQAVAGYYIQNGQIYWRDNLSNLIPSDSPKADDLVSFSVSYDDCPASFIQITGLQPGSTHLVFGTIIEVDGSVYYGLITEVKETTGSSGKNGEDATSIVIDSSRGVLFKNSIFETVLTVHVFKGKHEITNITDLHTFYGNSAYLQWYWRKYEDENWGTMLPTDSHITNDGFTLTVTPDDVNEKIVFKCELNT